MTASKTIERRNPAPVSKPDEQEARELISHVIACLNAVSDRERLSKSTLKLVSGLMNATIFRTKKRVMHALNSQPDIPRHTRNKMLELVRNA